jgi:hypothetical protein
MALLAYIFSMFDIEMPSKFTLYIKYTEKTAASGFWVAEQSKPRSFYCGVVEVRLDVLVAVGLRTGCTRQPNAGI